MTEQELKTSNMCEAYQGKQQKKDDYFPARGTNEWQSN